MQCPAFWSCVPLMQVSGPFEQYEEILARSKSYPLSIRMDPWGRPINSRYYHHSQKVELLRTQAYRIRQLHIKADATFLQQYQVLLLENTPRLESLDICPKVLGSRPLDQDRERLLQSPFVAHRVLTSQTIPSLRHLALTTSLVSPDWRVVSPSSLSVRDLTSLRLGFPPRVSAPPYPLLLNTLRASPHLQDIWLNGCITDTIAPFESSATLQVHRVDLPCLASIRIQDHVPLMVSFLSYLMLPLESKIDLHDSRPSEHFVDLSVEDRYNHIRDLFRYCSLETHGGQTAIARRYEGMSLCVDRGKRTELRLFNTTGPNAHARKHWRPRSDPELEDTSTSFVLKLTGNRYNAAIMEQIDQSLQKLEITYNN